MLQRSQSHRTTERLFAVARVGGEEVKETQTNPLPDVRALQNMGEEMKQLGIGCGAMVAAYFGIGLMIGTVAWLTDSTSDASTLGAIPVIACVWPLWLVMLVAFGG